MSEQPAFPHTETTVKMGTEFNSYHPGLTKREWFAGMAMQGILANPKTKVGEDDIIWGRMQKISEVAYLAADAMLKEAPDAE